MGNILKSSSGSTTTTVTDAVATALRAYYQTQTHVPAPPLAVAPQPINDINLSIVAIRQLPNPNLSARAEGKSFPAPSRKEFLGDYEKQFKLIDQAIKVESLFDKPFIRNAKEDEAKLGNIPAPKKLLILGQPGVGKSTMSQYMAYRWGAGTLWQNRFDYVFWIPLRQLRDEPAKSEWSLAKILYEHCINPADDSEKSLDETGYIQALQTLLNQSNSRILFLLDGYDEVAHLDVKGSFLRKVFEKVFYHNKDRTIDHAVIMTSRPLIYIQYYGPCPGCKR